MLFDKNNRVEMTFESLKQLLTDFATTQQPNKSIIKDLWDNSEIPIESLHPDTINYLQDNGMLTGATQQPEIEIPVNCSSDYKEGFNKGYVKGQNDLKLRITEIL